MTSRTLSRLTLAALLAGAQPALAAGVGEDDIDQLMSLSLLDLINIPVVTASRQPETRDHTPAHIMVVTREQIRERRYKNLADLLEDMPGVDFMRGTKSSQYNQFSIQGYTGPSELVVMLDGVRIGHPAGGNFPVAENLSLYLAKQVEFLYGPAAALYGADAVSGVINIITEHAGDQKGAWVQVGAGNFASAEGSFMAGLKNDEGLALSVGGHWQRSDRAPLQNYYPKEFAKKDAKTFAGAVVIPAAERENYVGGISSQSLFARMDFGRDLTFGFYRNVFRSLTSTGDTPATALYLEDSRWITQTDTVYGKLRFDLATDVSGELVVDYSRMEVDPRAKYVNIYNAYTNGYSYVRGDRLSVEQNLNWKLNDSQRIQAGLAYQRYSAIDTASLPAPYDTSKGPGGQNFFYQNTNIPRTIEEAVFDNYSAYGQLQSEWTRQLSTMVGLRLDRHSDYGSSLNPRLGAVWKANEEHVIKALYGEAFRAPSPEESLSSFGLFDGSRDADGLYKGTGFRVPNHGLQPEKSKTLSLTWDWRPRHDFNLVSNLYQSRIKNLIVTLPSSNVNAIPGAILINPETKGNAGEKTHKGLDLIGQWRFKLSSAWTGDLWASASWVKGKIEESNGSVWDASYIATHKYKLGTTFRHHDLFSITPQLLWIGDTANGRKNPTNIPPERRETPGYTLLNLHAGWHKLGDGKATLWLDVYNLLDRRYFAAGGSGSRTFFNMPQQPRTWMVSLEYRF